MPTPGYVFRDSGTTPLAEEESTTSSRQLGYEKSQSPASPQSSIRSRQSPFKSHASTSHAIAVADHDHKGAAQKAGNSPDITDLGWRSHHKDVDNLVGKLPNEELWTLIRRFNRQTYHVKATQPTPSGLDLNIADEDEFSPDKLRASIERLYMTVIIGLIGFGKHIARLRSWREPRRTAGFCAGYFVAWLIGYIVPVSILLLVTLIVYPDSRPLLFPPAPIALVNSKTGGVQKPRAGVLGSHDTLSGAPEKHQGEAAEQEASNLVNGIASVAIASAAGRHEQADPDSKTSALPDPTKIVSATAESKDSVNGNTHDKTKQPMEEAIWTKMRPAMHAIGDISDGWERIANALSPTPPFPHTAQYQLAGILAPVFLLSLFVKPAYVVHGTTFLSGLIFFTDPILQRGIQLLNEKIPDWPKYLEIRNTLLKGVPTNAQLAITLIRIGEANRAPLPPPPRSDAPPPDEPAHLDKDALALDADHDEIDEVINVSDSASTNEPTPKKSGAGAKIVSAFKSTTAAGVGTKSGADQIRAVIGSKHAKDKLGILPSREEAKKAPIEGPIEFKGRYKGKKGAVYIDSSVAPATDTNPARPCVYFSTDINGSEDIDHSTGKGSPQWSISIADIAEVKKVGGLGWKGKIIVGWATEREIKDGIEIVRTDGQKWRVTALKERDELFNRLIGIGGQVWESY